MTDENRRLIVMRHAKAEPFAAGGDQDRVLAARGLQDAAEAGRWAARNGVAPDHVVVSSAARTRGTWDGFAAAHGACPIPVIDRSLYAAGTDGAFEILRSVPPEARTVMLVGHNPTMAYLVHLLDDGGADPDVFAAVMAGYPTSALTVLDVAVPWADVDTATARIRRFHVGRG
ncbi:MAG: Phosphoglycerate mutase [Marmoricola sp.]|nr:Phosphoglycerate mutase [Marmoricola sp.]